MAGFDTERLVVDGGLLDNAPIKAVLDLIPARGAECQVKRYVCYLNADPPGMERPRSLMDPAIDPEEEAPETAPPTLLDLAKACVALPMKAPFIDQLDAIEHGTRRPALAGATEVTLLRSPHDSLRLVAETLLPVYRQRRRLLSLEELLHQPAEVNAVWSRLGTELGLNELPWVPVTLAADPRGRWGWGLLGAQRAIHLLIDALRLWSSSAQKAGDLARLTVLLGARARVYDELAPLIDKHHAALRDGEILAGVLRLADVDADVPAIVGKLSADWCRYDQAADFAVRRAAAIVLEDARPTEAGRDALFGPAGDVDGFISRARYVEVIRRSFDTERDIDTAEKIDFVQLTPFTPVPIFQRRGDPECPSTPGDKLAGIKLGHFAAFYRRAWRANDYMWGRLDASTRIVDLLVDHERARELDRYPGVPKAWDRLTDCLLPETATRDQIWLVRELLEAQGADEGDGLRGRLRRFIERDLMEGDGEGTRVACARAVQLEILSHELPILDASSTTDRVLGAASERLGLELSAGLKNAITELSPATGDESLPARLDARGKMEIGSNLGLRTATHAVFVVVASLRFAKVPFAHLLNVVRAVLLPISATVSRVGWYRVSVLIGFWAASVYITVRVVRPKPEVVALNAIWSKPVLLSGIALLAALGVIAVPVIRAIRGGGRRAKLANGATALVLAAVGGVGAVVLALLNGIDGEHLLVTEAPAAPPGWLMFTVFGVLLGAPIVRWRPAVQRRVSRVLARRKLSGAFTAAVATALTGWIVVWGIDALSDHIRLTLAWESVAAWAAVVGAPVAGGVYFGHAWLTARSFGVRKWVRKRGRSRRWLRLRKPTSTASV